VYYSIKHELHSIISGTRKVRHGETIQAITRYLAGSSEAGSKFEETKSLRQQETKRLEEYIAENKLWANHIDFDLYISEGAEQRVYLNGTAHVLKLNDAIYYSFWKDYFINLLFHNYFFEDTAYELLGFTKEADVLYAIVKQPYVIATQLTDLSKVREFMQENGFLNNRNNDYLHPELGIILEDLHDENVLTQNDLLYFIDTVFYATEQFWI